MCLKSFLVDLLYKIKIFPITCTTSAPTLRAISFARVFASSDIMLLGNESQTIGPQDAPMAVHLTLLGSDVVLLEGVRLTDVSEGVYLLNAAPLNLSGGDGAPCRAILIAD